MANIPYGYGQQDIYGQPQHQGYGPAQPAQFIVTNVEPQQKRNRGYTAANNFCVSRLGVTTVVIGFLCILFQIVASTLFYEHEGLAWSDGYVWSGVWLGMWFILTGVVGIASASNNEQGWIIAFLVLNIVSCSCVTWVMLGMASTSLGIIETCAQEYSYTYLSYYPYYETTLKPCTSPEEAGLAMNAMILISSLILFVVTVAASIIGCNSTCCPGSQGQVHTGTIVTGTPYVAHYSGGAVQISAVSQYPPAQQQISVLNAGVSPGDQLPTYSQSMAMNQAPSRSSEINARYHHNPHTAAGPQYTQTRT